MNDRSFAFFSTQKKVNEAENAPNVRFDVAHRPHGHGGHFTRAKRFRFRSNRLGRFQIGEKMTRTTRYVSFVLVGGGWATPLPPLHPVWTRNTKVGGR